MPLLPLPLLTMPIDPTSIETIGLTAAAISASFGLTKLPIWHWLATPFVTRRKVEAAWREDVTITAENMDSRITAVEAQGIDTKFRLHVLEQAVAPNNGDRRSISDRVDTVRYQGRVLNNNLEIIAEWLHSQNPSAPAPAIHPLPER